MDYFCCVMFQMYVYLKSVETIEGHHQITKYPPLSKGDRPYYYSLYLLDIIGR